MKKKEKFKVTVSTVSGSSFLNFVKLMRGNEIDVKYYPRFIASAGLSLFAEPFRWYEHLRYDAMINRFKFEKAPIFILGHWRSGTTFLHNVMCQDPAAGYVTTYHGIFPELLLGSKWLFKNFMKANMPDKRPSDNMELSADFPQEEEFALGNVNPYGFYNFWFFPKRTREYYEKYIEFNGVSEKVRTTWKKDYIRLAKKALINTGGQHFISKNPPHTGRIEILLEAFPDARFIHIYRNPYTVFISTKRLIEKTIPPLNFHDISDQELEDNIFWLYNRVLHKYLEEKSLIKPENLIEIKFEDFERDTLGWLEKIYEHLNISDLKIALPCFRKYIDSQSSYKKNKYTISRHLVDKISAQWQFAIDHWGYEIPDNMDIVD